MFLQLYLEFKLIDNNSKHTDYNVIRMHQGIVDFVQLIYDRHDAVNPR